MIDFSRLEYLKGWNSRIIAGVRSTWAYERLQGATDIPIRIVDGDEVRSVSPPGGAGYLSLKGLVGADLVDKVDKISRCASFAELTRVETVEPSGIIAEELKVLNANFCRQAAICPVCAAQQGSRRWSRYSDRIKKACELYNYAYFITFTIKPEIRLARARRKLRKSLKRFRMMGQVRPIIKYKNGQKMIVGNTRGGGEWGIMESALLSIEQKRGEGSKLWHVHAHSIVFTNKRLDWSIYDKKKRKAIQKIFKCKPALEKLVNDTRKKYGSDVADNLRRSVSRGKPAPDDLMLAAGSWRALAVNDVNNKPIKILVPVSKISGEWWSASNKEGVSVKVKPLNDKKTGLINSKNTLNAAHEIFKYMSKLNGQKPEDILEILADSYGDRNFEPYGPVFRDIPDPVLPARKENDTVSVRWIPGALKYGAATFNDQAVSVGDSKRARFREWLHKQGIMLGDYRRSRRGVFESSESQSNKIKDILYCRDSFKNAVRRLWEKYRAFDPALPAVNTPLPGRGGPANTPPSKEYSDPVQCFIPGLIPFLA